MEESEEAEHLGDHCQLILKELTDQLFKDRVEMSFTVGDEADRIRHLDQILFLFQGFIILQSHKSVIPNCPSGVFSK